MAAWTCSDEIISEGSDTNYCKTGMEYLNDPGCRDGFFSRTYNQSSAYNASHIRDGLPCCHGYYCPASTACLMVCSCYIHTDQEVKISQSTDPSLEGMSFLAYQIGLHFTYR